MKLLKKIIIVIFFAFFYLSAVSANVDSFIKPLLPGDIIFCKGVIASETANRFNATALHGHMSIYLGKKDEFSKFLRKDQVEKYLNNWIFGDHNPFGKFKEDSIIAFDVYPEPIIKGTNVRIMDIESNFFKDATAQKYPIPLSEEQRQKILQFVFDKVYVKFDLEGILSSNDSLWTCWDICEVAYEKAGVSFFEYMGLDFSIVSAIELPFLFEKENSMFRQIMSFFLMDFATVEVSNNFKDKSAIKYYAVHLKKEYSPQKIVSIIRIKHDKKIVDMFSEMTGFKKLIAGPFNSEEETLKFISSNWDKNYPEYLAKLKAG